MLLGPGSDSPHLLFHISIGHCERVIVPHEVKCKYSGIPFLTFWTFLEGELPHSPPQRQGSSPGHQGVQEGDVVTLGVPSVICSL